MAWGFEGQGVDCKSMLATIAREVDLTRTLTGRAALDPRVLAALAQVPREDFVPGHLRSQAYENHPLPIGEGQTISQPFIVALMTDLLETRPEHRVLEIGTGSGYQAAILSVLVKEVFSVEVIPSLARQAAERLERLGYANVAVSCRDGTRGWAEHAPYDGIIVTAAAPVVPAALLTQLKVGRPLVIPVGPPYMGQQLQVWRRDAAGQTHVNNVLDVVFVPLTGGGRSGGGSSS